MEAVRGRTLTEGVGIEGVLTVFDETPRMYRSLGDPRRDQRYPLWYFYDQGPFRLTVRAAVKDGRFLIQSILYTGDNGTPKALVTSRGIRLGAHIDQVIEIYGKPGSRTPQELRYPGAGVVFHMGKRGDVIGITVERPTGKTPNMPGRHATKPHPVPEQAKPEELHATPAPPLVAPSPPKPTGLADLGLMVPHTSAWKPAAPLTASGGKLTAAGGVVELAIWTCTGCAEQLVERVRAFEKEMDSPNRIPKELTDLDRRSLERVGAERGYVGRYVPVGGGRLVWLLAYQQKERSHMLVLSLRTDQPAQQPNVALVADVLDGIRLLGEPE